ncbi:hypothetical protein P0M11_11205 [Kaistella sp. PBT33-4]|uniref:hypothetical protein n=1 Tax=Kaistella sp. PBT33-4 TaxID=3032000 RepID=UPI0023D88B24|nr:hypothetical protein [Kaistella sp. PBT33-4]MDF0720565.1 hypothetical protein [Kaistella sp. PBT33-4]
MKTTYNKENLQTHLEEIKPTGYTLESFENEFFYTKNEASRKITITLFYDEYFPHDVICTGISVSILFYNVEQIFHDVYVNNPISDFKHTLNKTNSFKKGFTYILTTIEKNKLKNTKVFDDASFAQVKPLLEQMINAAVSFVNQNQTLQDFYDLGETMNEDDQLNFYIHPASFRMAIVKKLLNLPYTIFLQNEINLYNQHNMSDVSSFAVALKNHLDSI